MIKIDTERKRRFLINFAYYVIFAVIAYVLIKYAFPLLSPFVFAVLIAYMLQRPVRLVSRKLNISRRPCGAVMAVAFFGIVGGLVSLVGMEIISGAQNLIKELPGLYNGTFKPLMLEVFAKIEDMPMWQNEEMHNIFVAVENQIVTYLGDLVGTISAGAVGAISSFAASVPMLFIKLVLLIIATIFMTMDYDRLTGFCLRQMSEGTRDLFWEVKNYVVGTLFVCIASYALIMSITCVELCIGLSLIGIEKAILIAVCIAIFDILPVLGTGGIMIPWAVINLVLGSYKLALSLFVVYLVITVIRNILEPKIVGGQLGLHPVVTLASLFAGAQLLGPVGLFGFPIFISLLCHLNEKGIIKLFK